MRKTIWNARWPCSNLDATTISRSALDGTRRRGDALPRAHIVADGRRRTCGFPRSRRADADRGPVAYRHPCEREHAAALFELMRGGLSHAALNAAELARIAREHDLPMWKAFGLVLMGVATAEGGA